MNLSQDDTSNNVTSQQHSDDDVFLQAHDLTVDMDDAEHLIVEVDAGRTAIKGDGVFVETGNNTTTENDVDASYLGEMDINHPEDNNSQPDDESQTEESANNSENQNQTELPGENRLIPGSYDVRNNSPMQYTPPPIGSQDPFLMG